MSLGASSYTNYTKQTAREALCWLKAQKEDWAKQIRDVDVAVQLYLNFKNRQRIEKRVFSSELQKLCVNGSVPVQAPEQDEKPDQTLSSGTEYDSATPSPSSVFLDEKTRELLARTAARLNLSHEKEALNVLVQFGFASLQSLLKDL